MLQKEAEDWKKEIKRIFENNLKKGNDLRVIWDARKAFIRYCFIQHNNALKKKRQDKT